MLMWVDRRYGHSQSGEEEFNTAGRSVNMGLIACESGCVVNLGLFRLRLHCLTWCLAAVLLHDCAQWRNHKSMLAILSCRQLNTCW